MPKQRAAIPVNDFLSMLRDPRSRARHWREIQAASTIDRQTTYRILYRGRTPSLDTLQRIAASCGGEVVILLPSSTAATLSRDNSAGH